MGADAPTQTGRFEDALLPHSFGVPFRKRSVTEARHFRNKLNGLCLSTQPYLQIYKIPKIPLRIKKIDCLTTTNLVNLKSNTMKNTLQMYGLFHLLYKIRHTKCITQVLINLRGQHQCPYCYFLYRYPRIALVVANEARSPTTATMPRIIATSPTLTATG